MVCAKLANVQQIITILAKFELMLAFVLNQIFANKSDAPKFVKFSKYEALGQEAGEAGLLLLLRPLMHCDVTVGYCCYWCTLLRGTLSTCRTCSALH